MTCTNAATTIKKIIDTMLLDTEGNITKEAISAMETGSNYLKNINEGIIRGGISR